MSENNQWSDISKDIKEVKNKIKSKIDEEDLLEDLKESFKQTIENTAGIIDNLIKTVDSTIKDDEIKLETKKIIKEINIELKNLIVKSGNNFSEKLNFDFLLEEE